MTGAACVDEGAGAAGTGAGLDAGDVAGSDEAVGVAVLLGVDTAVEDSPAPNRSAQSSTAALKSAAK
ncbi:hypothetical protein B843_01305 [Corynebacterium vitaeruminis DSM 20294]|uniref:Uncharacterized protein n=1 Tax=Corynebacterium vitaeruminis DSM 20294 TaxID=1224164 RepID=W5XXG2_9CORY|nr:hypothetical protein B843_01305 [Corynebacterium vitaeruminis DSM 20294]